ncbi:MAG: helix-turn-helix domain-containing protein [Clostridium sp.]|nr:helix-turn-helix domain-containing protein [Clostridium sp.]
MKIYDYNGKKNLCGEKIRQARAARHLTQSELAARLQCCGITIERDSISRIEIGTRFIADYELKTIAQILDISLDWLLDNATTFS